MDWEAVRTVLDQTRVNLRQMDEEIEKYIRQKKILEALVIAMQAALDAHDQGTFPVGSAPISADEGAQSKPVWELVRDVFPKNGGTLTVPEIHKRLQSMMGNAPKQDAIRVAIRRKPDVFENQGSGVYVLKSQRAPMMFDTKEDAINALNAMTGGR